MSEVPAAALRGRQAEHAAMAARLGQAAAGPGRRDEARTYRDNAPLAAAGSAAVSSPRFWPDTRLKKEATAATRPWAAGRVTSGDLTNAAKLFQAGGSPAKGEQPPPRRGRDISSDQETPLAAGRGKPPQPRVRPRPGKPIRLGVHVYVKSEDTPCKLFDDEAEQWILYNIDLLSTTYHNLYSDRERPGKGGTFSSIRRDNPDFLGIIALQAELLQPYRYVVDAAGSIDQRKAVCNAAVAEPGLPESSWAQRLLTASGEFSQYMISLWSRKADQYWCDQLRYDDPRRQSRNDLYVQRTVYTSPALMVRLKQEGRDAPAVDATAAVARAMLAMMEAYAADGCLTDNTLVEYPMPANWNEIRQGKKCNDLKNIDFAWPYALYFHANDMEIDQRNNNRMSVYKLAGHKYCIGETVFFHDDDLRQKKKRADTFNDCRKDLTKYYGKHIEGIAKALEMAGKWYLPNTSGWYGKIVRKIVDEEQIEPERLLDPAYYPSYLESTARGCWCEKWIQKSRVIHSIEGLWNIMMYGPTPALRRRLGQSMLEQWQMEMLHAVVRSATSPFLVTSAFSTVDDLQLPLASYLIAKSSDLLKLHLYPFLPFVLPRSPEVRQPCVAGTVGRRAEAGSGYFFPFLQGIIGDARDAAQSRSYTQVLLDADLGDPLGPLGC
ncbi:MAG: hypothetical protein FJ125_00965 [Deltaproteobacteria bacterium]|nr:hypothetical protein [Deltaproteobacteria bacterium]